MVQQHVRLAHLRAGVKLIVVPKRKPIPYPHLLPPNATRWEKAHGSQTGRITAIPTPVQDVWRHISCPTQALPWLAWAMSVDIWDNRWPEARKRNLIYESFHLHFRQIQVHYRHCHEVPLYCISLQMQQALHRNL